MTRDRISPAVRTAFAAAAMALVCTPLAAGVVYETETTDPRDPKAAAVRSQTLIEGTNVKIQSPTAKGLSEIVYRGDRREMIIIDHDKKSYATVDPQRVADMMAGLSGQKEESGETGEDSGMADAMKMLEEQMAGLSEEDRKLLQSAVKGSVTEKAARRPATTIKASGESAMQADWSCKIYDVQRGEEMVRQLCVTSWERMEGGMEAKAALRSFADFHKALMAEVEKGPFADMVRVEGGVEDLFRIGGFPVKSVSFAKGKATSETVLTSASSATLPASTFEVPAGYSAMTLGR